MNRHSYIRKTDGTLARCDVWAEGIIDWFDRFFKSVELDRAIWLIIGVAVGYFGHVISVIINRPH
jgi:hypothetical protein